MKNNTWHFKLHMYESTDTAYRLINGQSVSLCSYFWATIFAMLCLTVRWLSKLVVIFFGFIILFSPIYALLASFTEWYFLSTGYAEIGFAVMFASLIIISTSGILAAIGGDIKVWPKWLPVDVWTQSLFKGKPKKSKPKETQLKKPNLLFDYIKAKKDKVCPLIKLEK